MGGTKAHKIMNIRPAIFILNAKSELLTMHYRYGNEDVYNLPGGNLEFGETMAHTLLRELQEELLIDIEVGSLRCVAEVHFPEKQMHTIHCIFNGKITQGEPILNPTETKALGIRWIPWERLSEVNLYPNITEALVENGTAIYLGKINQKWF